ncbi:Ina1p NDAI_0J02660 [Naumovozyma dairenensis CBS 421]|uniref:Uncharacterized protein n=1 Tax=Naumovozyma dairenensis (strain ATCC 10597 / BCRC 20456 / CBS 421 / NBRC 0211 / NRRL Y-12639) TaxID=1071378 RepID=G0WH80_NAUDC|nr:hypothetical protein NDAI_0J02660 [Naumovozyma dairenensis CBS 421]CCD27158.1 hypothetical protein NDAI_0J02660 [Naumovozyma dairenensis CBS 421]
MLNKKIILLSSCLFSLTTFLLVIIATAGSSSDYKPLTNIYIGEADISKINVTKVAPQFGPVLAILGSALAAPNVTVTDIFDPLKALSTTPALKPLLTLLSAAENTTETVSSILNLAPLALSSSNSTTLEIEGIIELLSNSKNVSQTLDGFNSLMGSMSANTSLTELAATASLETTVFQLLADSANATSSVESLITLNNMTVAEKAQLVPAFSLFSASNNITATFSALVALMNATIPSSLADTLFNSLQTAINSDNDNALATTFTSLGSLVPTSMSSSLEAEELLFNVSNSANTTLSTLEEMIADNITTSQSAKTALTSLSTIVNNASNKTLVLSSVEELSSSSSDASSSTAQLVVLDELLSSSYNDTKTVSTLTDLSGLLIQDISSLQYVPDLLNLMKSSSNATSTLSSLLDITSWAKNNTATFLPLMTVLTDANSSGEVSQEYLEEITPSILGYLNVPVKFRLSIFTLCHVNLAGELTSCTKSHTVQNLDFRQIIYDSLLISDFKPYMDALNIGKWDLHLDGSLQNKQHEYVPAIKATLAMNLIAIISLFFTMGFLLFMAFSKRAISMKLWYCLILTFMWDSLFVGLGSTIVSAMIGIIKRGTKKDKYDVIFTTGSAYCGLTWAGFCIIFLTLQIIIYATWMVRKENGTVVQNVGSGDLEEGINVDTGSSSSKVSERNVEGVIEKNFEK